MSEQSADTRGAAEEASEAPLTDAEAEASQQPPSQPGKDRDGSETAADEPTGQADG